MAIYKIFPTEDTTLYSMYPTTNTGLDEIIESSLEVGALFEPNPQASRFLVKFSSLEISNTINNIITTPQWVSNLRCFTANVTALNSDTTIEIYPVSQSWNMGTGKSGTVPEISNGASWIWKNYKDGERWTSGSFAAGSTGSYSSLVDMGGGTWYVTSSLSASQTFGYYDDKDININVTKIVSAWYSSSLINNGFILKQKDEFIDNEYIQPKMKYFSKDTHTIYPPYLEFKWNDSNIVTGSLSFINSHPFEISLGDNIGTFYSGSINKFRVFSRPAYPVRTFMTSSLYTINYYLPTSSYYAIKDMDTNEYVINFDPIYTKLSLDTTSSYFSLYMNGLQPERYYKILFQTTVDGSVNIIDNNYYFKIVNG